MTVFVVQQQMKYDKERGELVDRFPLIHKAEQFGELSHILSPSAHPFNPERVLGDIHEALSGFSDDDLLLLIGNPVLIGWCVTVAAHYNEGRVRALQWSGRHSKYTEITAKII